MYAMCFRSWCVRPVLGHRLTSVRAPKVAAAVDIHAPGYACKGTHETLVAEPIRVNITDALLRTHCAAGRHQVSFDSVTDQEECTPAPGGAASKHIMRLGALLPLNTVTLHSVWGALLQKEQQQQQQQQQQQPGPSVRAVRT